MTTPKSPRTPRVKNARPAGLKHDHREAVRLLEQVADSVDMRSWIPSRRRSRTRPPRSVPEEEPDAATPERSAPPSV
jgi:hypothetical protein